MINYFEFALILTIIVLGFWVWKLYLEKQEAEKEVVALEKENQEMEQTLEAASAGAAASQGGLEEYHKKMQEKKQRLKNEILQMIVKKAKASNMEISSALGISSRTTVRYLDELEKEEKVKQVGKTGKNVFYQIAKNIQ